MYKVRLLMAGVVATLTLGSLAASGGYAWYLRSDRYRAHCNAVLSESLSLPSDIGRVIPLSRLSRAFEDVRVWLPDKRALAHRVQHATLNAVPTANDPKAYELRLSGGETDVSDRTWMAGDFRRVVDAELRGGFLPNGPDRVIFDDFRIVIERDRLRLNLDQAAGLLDFTRPDVGLARIECHTFNGHPCEEPALLTAQFSQRDSGIRIDQLELTVSPVPVSAIGLAESIGLSVASGAFGGKLRYGESAEGRWFELSGVCRDLNLAELTAGLAPHAWTGRCPEIDLLELSGKADALQRLRFRGGLKQLRPAEIAATWSWPDVGGTLDFSVADADVSRSGIARFIATGAGLNISLEAITTALGWGRASGSLRLRVNDLTIENDHLKSLDAVVQIDADDATPRWIEGALLRNLVDRALQIQLPPILPERVEYSKLGVKLEIRDEVLTVFGTHGPRENTILTIKLLGQELPLVFEPKESFNLGPYFDQLRAAALSGLKQRAPQFIAPTQ